MPPSDVDTTVAATRNPVWRQYLRALGPGLVTGASDDDPSAIVTYATAGVRAGGGLLWTCTLSFPLMLAVQLSADRTALATGRSLGELARERFGRGGRSPWPGRAFGALLVAHVLANVLVLAADLIAVGAGIDLLVGRGSPAVWVFLAGVAISGLLLSGSFSTIANVLKLLCLALVAYVAVLFVVDVEWGEVARSLVVPRLPTGRNSTALLLAVLGATLPPYVFFWQSVHRLEELREDPAPRVTRQKERTSVLDVACGMAFAVAVMFAVMVATSATNIDEVRSAADVARALEPVAGGLAKALFAVGFVAAGVLAVPVLAGAGSAAVAGFLGKDWGFSRSPREAPAFYALVAAGTLAGTGLGLVGADPVRLLVGAATINGLTSAPLLAVVMLLAGDRALLGAHRPSALVRMLGWLAVAVMGAAAVGAVLATAL